MKTNQHNQILIYNHRHLFGHNNRNKYDMVEYTHRIRMWKRKKGIFFLDFFRLADINYSTT